MLGWLFGRGGEKRSIENPSVPINGALMDALTGGVRRSSSGLNVGPREALGCSPVWSAVDQISADVARLPWRIYREGNRGIGVEQRKHPLWRLLGVTPDGHSSALEFVQRILANALLFGNGFAVIERGRVGNNPAPRPKRLIFVPSSQVTVDRIGGMNYYRVMWQPGDVRDGQSTYDAGDMFHLKGLTFHEFGGLSLIDYARDTIGRTLAAAGYGDDFFANHAVPNGFFKHPQQLKGPALENFLASMRASHSGAGKRHRFGLLEQGMDFVASGISPQDALLVDMLKLSVPDVARFFTIPPHKLGDAAKQGWNTTESENRSYLNSTLGKWMVRLDAEAAVKLLTEDEQTDHYLEHDTWGLLVANTKERYDAYGVGIQWGILTRNEARAWESLEPVEGGDEILTPVNMTAGDPTEKPQPEPVPAAAAVSADVEDDVEPEAEPKGKSKSKDKQRSAQAAAAERVIADVLERMGRRVVRTAERHAKEPREFWAHVQSLESSHGDAVRQALVPVAQLAAAHRGEGTAGELVEQFSGQFFRGLSSVLIESSECDRDELAGAVAGCGAQVSAMCRDWAGEFLRGKVSDEN